MNVIMRIKDMEFSGKVVLVTGAGQGIGKAIAIAFGTEGAFVAVNDQHSSNAESTANDILSIGSKAIPISADVASEKDVRSMVDRVVDEWGGIDILVNNAGALQSVMVEDLRKTDWDRILDANLGGVFNCSKAVIGTMKARGGGRIVSIASLAGKTMSYLGGADYTASKAGVLGFTRHLAFELGPYKINVNAVCPGLVLTPLAEKELTSQAKEMIRRRTPLRDFVTPMDVANTVLFLSSEKAKMITGSTIDVDGGIGLGVQDWESYVESRKTKLKR